MHGGDIQYLRERMDEVSEVLTRNTVILEQNTDSLKEHMRRTAALEGQMETALIPIKLAKWLGIIITCLGTAIGAILGITQLLH